MFLNPNYLAYYTNSPQNFVGFNIVKNQKDLVTIKDSFLNLLKNSNKDTVFNTLYELLQTIGNKLKLSIFKALDIEVYLVIIHGSHDGILQQCGTSHGLPRGCPIIYIPETKYIKINGFYPKFTNTDKGNNFKEELQKVMDSQESITSISINMKVSGFLGIIIAFSYKGNKYWTITTKKAADYDHEAGFIKKAKNIIEKSMTCEIVTHLIDEGLCLCGEFLSPEDNTHGYITKKPLFIPTCIGKTVSNQHELFIGKIMFYYTLPEIYEFCQKFNLSCGDQYKFNSSDPEIIVEFLKNLFHDYSLITASEFENRIQELKRKYSDAFNILPGSFVHSKDISDIIEGCILFIGNKMLKVKFGLYVIATMFFRPYIINKSILYNETSFCSRWIEDKHSDSYNKMCAEGIRIIDENPDILPSIVRDEVYKRLCDNKIELEIKCKKKCTIILIVGPVGSGKSTMGENIAKQENKKFPTIHVDGDLIYNIDAKIFGRHRNFATMSMIYKFIIDGYNIVFSLGGGVCLGGYKTPSFAFLERLQTIFPNVNFKLSLIYFSSELDNIKISTSEPVNINIGDIEHYKNVVEERQPELSKSEHDKLVKIYHDVSKKNADLIQLYFLPEYFVKIIGVPFKYDKLDIHQIFPDFEACSKKIEYNYYRIYHVVSCPEIEQILHITLGYSKTPLNPDLERKNKDGDIIMGDYYEKYFIKNDETNIQLYSVAKLPNDQHVTINSGSAPPEISKELLNNLSSKSFTIVRGKDKFTFFSDQPVNYKRKGKLLSDKLEFIILCTISGGLSE